MCSTTELHTHTHTHTQSVLYKMTETYQVSQDYRRNCVPFRQKTEKETFFLKKTSGKLFLHQQKVVYNYQFDSQVLLQSRLLCGQYSRCSSIYNPRNFSLIDQCKLGRKTTRPPPRIWHLEKILVLPLMISCSFSTSEIARCYKSLYWALHT